MIMILIITLFNYTVLPMVITKVVMSLTPSACNNKCVPTTTIKIISGIFYQGFKNDGGCFRSHCRSSPSAPPPFFISLARKSFVHIETDGTTNAQGIISYIILGIFEYSRRCHMIRVNGKWQGFGALEKGERESEERVRE